MTQCVTRIQEYSNDQNLEFYEILNMRMDDIYLDIEKLENMTSATMAKAPNRIGFTFDK